MKRIAIIIMTILVMAVFMTAAGCGKNENESKIYPICGEIIGINREKDIVTFCTSTGNKFSFYGAEDYAEGDIVACIMDDNGTPGIYDDRVIMAYYQG